MSNDKSAEIVRGLLAYCNYEVTGHGERWARVDIFDLQQAATKITELNDFTSSQCAKLLERVAEMEAQLTASQQETRAAVEDSALRKNTELTPIYTSGGHGGYYDDDDEDFWCPVCHGHLGTHRGFATTCPRCGQRVNHDSEPLYNYRDMRESEAQWRGPQEAGRGWAE